MTALQWLEQEWNKYDLNLGKAGFKFKIEQAKEMEKQQIIDAWNSAYGGDSNYTGYEYYNETFKSE